MQNKKYVLQHVAKTTFVYENVFEKDKIQLKQSRF